NNVDVRTGFPWGSGTIDLVAAENRANNTLLAFGVDAATRQLTDIAGTPTVMGSKVYGFGLYHSATTGRFYAFVGANKNGEIRQFELNERDGGVVGTLVRTLHLTGQTEGI